MRQAWKVNAAVVAYLCPILGERFTAEEAVTETHPIIKWMVSRNIRRTSNKPFPGASDIRACAKELSIPGWNTLQPMELLASVRSRMQEGPGATADKDQVNLDEEEVQAETPTADLNEFLEACDASPDTTILTAEMVDASMKHFWAAFQAALRNVTMGRDSSSNISEVLNKLLVKPRETLPPALLFQHMMQTAHGLLVTLRKEMEEACASTCRYFAIVPLARRTRRLIVEAEKLHDEEQLILENKSVSYNHVGIIERFVVKSNTSGVKATVNVATGTCSCGFWQTEQIVCKHVVAGIRAELIAWPCVIARRNQPRELLKALQGYQQDGIPALPEVLKTSEKTQFDFPHSHKAGRKKVKRYLSIAEQIANGKVRKPRAKKSRTSAAATPAASIST